ncbi:MAG TPA: methyltransferase, TIGR04325 family [Caulobacteraceae bacterium]|nr:methyltransferase, TIGR04325 family [Caulobacteraceae bacterium]
MSPAAGGRPGAGARLQRGLQLLTPPLVWRLLRRLRPDDAPLDGPLADWAAAAGRATGWDSPGIAREALRAAEAVRDGVAAFERDSRPLERIIYSPTILAALLLALDRYGRLNVVDFGGGLGSNFHQNIKLIRALAHGPTDWRVVERPSLARLGAERFQTPGLRFYADLDAARLEDAVLMFTGSLQYVEDAFGFLDDAVRGFDIVALDRVLVSEGDEHEVYLQRLDRDRFGDVTLATWCFSAAALIGWFEAHGFELVERFRPPPRPRRENCGMLFLRRAAEPTPSTPPS